MFSSQKILYISLIVCGLFFIPSHVFARNADKFSAHCSQNPEFNSFADITTNTDIKNARVVMDDNGQPVVVFELGQQGQQAATGNSNANTSEIQTLEMKGKVPKNVTHVWICESNMIVGLIPSYKVASDDESRLFDFQFDLNVGTTVDQTTRTVKTTVEAQNLRYMTSDATGNVISQTMTACSDPNDPKCNLNDPRKPFEEVTAANESTYLGYITPETKDTILGGMKFHTAYASYFAGEGQLNMQGFTLMNFEKTSKLKYATMPPIEKLSACNASSIASLSVEDIRCFPLAQQVNFKKYFLGLPEILQKLFDFDDDPCSQSNSNSPCNDENSNSMARPLLVNYFDEKIPTDKKDDLRPPQSGDYLSVSKDPDGTIRYMKTGKDPLSATDNGLISYYDSTGQFLDNNPNCNGDSADANCKTNFANDYQCNVTDVTKDLLSDIGTTPGTGTSVSLFPKGCASQELSTNAEALGKFVNLPALVQVNEEAQCACLKVKIDLGTPLSTDEEAAKNSLGCMNEYSAINPIPIIQSLNAAAVAITQNVGYNMAAFEGFNACQKILALNTLSKIIDASLQVVKHQAP